MKAFNIIIALLITTLVSCTSASDKEHGHSHEGGSQHHNEKHTEQEEFTIKSDSTEEIETPHHNHEDGTEHHNH